MLLAQAALFLGEASLVDAQLVGFYCDGGQREEDARARAESKVPGGEVAEGEQCDLFNLHMESSVRHLLSLPNPTGAAHVFASPGLSLPS